MTCPNAKIDARVAFFDAPLDVHAFVECSCNRELAGGFIFLILSHAQDDGFTQQP
jgi:hypothetical protein